MKSILLIAYECDPTRGSESLIGWKWSTLLAEHFDVTVLTHPRNRIAIGSAMPSMLGKTLRFEYVSLPTAVDPWQTAPAERCMSFRYTAWQLFALEYSRRLQKSRRYDAVHHCSWGSLTGPTFAWATGLPFIWGPIGGGQTTPLCLAPFLGDGIAKEYLRNWRLRLLHWMPWVRLAASRARVVFATNRATLDALQRVGAKDVRLLSHCAIANEWRARTIPLAGETIPQIVWVGRLLSRKAPLLAVEVFARVLQQCPARLVVVGDGPQRTSCEERVEAHGIGEHVNFLGYTPHSEIPQILAASQLLMFTSIRDSYPEVVLEALAAGVPAVLLDHNGAEQLPANAVIRVPISTAEKTAEEFAATVVRLLGSHSLRAQMSEDAIRSIREENMWSHRLNGVLAAYNEVL